MKWDLKFSMDKIYLFVLIVIFLLFAYTAFYTHPCYDDFSFSATSATRSFGEDWTTRYFGLSGRYFFLMLLPLNPIVFGSFIGCQYLLAFLIMLLPFSLYFFIDALFGKSIIIKDQFIITFLLSILFYYLLPALPEALYWYTGLVNYQLPVMLTVTFLGFFTHIFNGTYVFSYKKDLLLLILLQFAIIGSSEINLVYLGLFLFFMLLYFFFKHKSIPSFLKILFFFAILFSAFSLLSPGNGARATNYPQKYQLWHSIYNSSLQTARFSIAWISSPLLLVSSLLFLQFNKQNANVFSEKIRIHPIITTIALGVIIFFSAFLPYWATGIQGQHRTVNVACQFFILCWFVNLGAIINRYPDFFLLLKNKLSRISLFYPILLILAILFSGNTNLLIGDYISGRITKHHNLLTQRENTLRTIPVSTEKIYLPILDKEDLPRSIFLYEIKEDPCDHINQSYTLYFQLQPCAVNIENDEDK